MAAALGASAATPSYPEKEHMQGFIHPTAEIGNPPEHREWISDQSQPIYSPEIDPTARVNAFVTIDAGFSYPTRVGPRTLLMAHTHLGHDVQVGGYCELAPGTVIGGYARIGNYVKFGVNSCVKPFVTIGDGARIGMGAVVIRDVPAGEVWAGNPARRIK